MCSLTYTKSSNALHSGSQAVKLCKAQQSLSNSMSNSKSRIDKMKSDYHDDASLLRISKKTSFSDFYNMENGSQKKKATG